MVHEFTQRYAEAKNLAGIQDIPRKDWKRYLSSQPSDGRVSISIMHSAIGEQQEVISAGLLGLSYDEKEGSIYIFAEGISHLIEKPDSLAAFLSDKKTTIAIHDEQGRLHVIEISPAPSTTNVSEGPVIH